MNELPEERTLRRWLSFVWFVVAFCIGYIVCCVVSLFYEIGKGPNGAVWAPQNPSSSFTVSGTQSAGDYGTLTRIVDKETGEAFVLYRHYTNSAIAHIPNSKP